MHLFKKRPGYKERLFMRSFRKYIEYDKRKNVNIAMLIFTLLFLSGFLTAGFLYKGGNVTFYGKFLPCPFHTITGLSCPGCGMTRAVYALYDGNIEESLLQNPSIIYFLAIFIIYEKKKASWIVLQQFYYNGLAYRNRDICGDKNDL